MSFIWSSEAPTSTSTHVLFQSFVCKGLLIRWKLKRWDKELKQLLSGRERTEGLHRGQSTVTPIYKVKPSATIKTIKTELEVNFLKL